MVDEGSGATEASVGAVVEVVGSMVVEASAAGATVEGAAGAVSGETVEEVACWAAAPSADRVGGGGDHGGCRSTTVSSISHQAGRRGGRPQGVGVGVERGHDHTVDPGADTELGDHDITVATTRWQAAPGSPRALRG